MENVQNVHRGCVTRPLGFESCWGCPDKIRWICFKTNRCFFDLKKENPSAAGSKSIPDCLEQDMKSCGPVPLPHALHSVSHTAESLLHTFRPVEAGKSLCRTLCVWHVRVRGGLPFKSYLFWSSQVGLFKGFGLKLKQRWCRRDINHPIQPVVSF